MNFSWIILHVENVLGICSNLYTAQGICEIHSYNKFLVEITAVV